MTTTKTFLKMSASELRTAIAAKTSEVHTLKASGDEKAAFTAAKELQALRVLVK